MTRHFASLLTVTAALLPMVAVNASAQNSAHVNVPFAFVANQQAVPAGNYQVLASNNSLTIINTNTGKPQAILVVRHEAGPAIESKGMLTFKMSGGRHILTEAQFAGSSTHSELLTQPKQERRIASNTQSTSTAQLAMK